MYGTTSSFEGVTALPYRGRRTVDAQPLAMTADQFEAIAIYLYGHEWKAALAEETNFKTDRLREMAKGKRRVPQSLAQHLLDAMATDREYVDAAHEVATEAAAQLASFIAATEQ